MPRTEDGQYELVLENRQVLGIFFVAAVLCGVFFALGYIVGKNTAGPFPPQPSQTTLPATSEGKRSPLAPAENPTSEAKPATDATAPNPAGKSAAPSQRSGQSSESTAKGAGQGAKPESQPVPDAGAITLQVAALSKSEDAVAMVDLLKSRNFSASILNLAGDRLYRVQVGPFASLQDAEAAKARLEKEGFKPILKKN